jgi:hypothetical protein
MKYPPILRALALSSVLCLLSTVGAHAGDMVPIVFGATDAEATNGTPGVFPDAAQVKNQVDSAVATPVSWQGTWAAETDYSAGQGVIHEGSSYAAVGDPTAGDVPGVDADWQLIAAKGADGEPGTPGTPGDDGASAYVYIAYASADDGTGFTTTYDADLDYIAILATDTAIPSPTAGDFAGLWKNTKGTPGSTGATGAGYGGTSTTSLAIGTGSKSLTTQTGLAYVVGSYVRLVSAADVANYMEGTVSAYTSGTGAMTVSVGVTGGSGTHTDWNVSLAGKLGETQTIPNLIVETLDLQGGVTHSAALATDDTYNGTTIAGLNNSGGVTQWEIVYLNASSQWVLADANGTGTYPARGIAIATATTGNATTVLIQGTVRNDAWDWTPGGTLYLSATPGALTQSAPSTSGDKVQQVGYALTADIAAFDFASGEYLTVQ